MNDSTCTFWGPLDEPESEISLLVRNAIFEGLIHAPILVGNLPESAVFDREPLHLPHPVPPLNFQQKLGHLYEEAFATLLRFCPNYNLLEANLPVRRDQHNTVGELDFLLRERGREKMVHLELAIKFYLAVDTDQGPVFPGPDARDHYMKKIARLREHQLTLTQRHREHLPTHYQDTEIVTRHLVLGTLFDHICAPTPSKPEFLSQQARRGQWLEVGDLRKHFDKRTPLRVIPKPLWGVPSDFLGDLNLEPFSPPPTLERCQMVLTPDHDALFVTPNRYPNHQGAGIR